MSAIPKRKMCWNCEGNIAVDENHCPYCGVFQSPFGLAEGGHVEDDGPANKPLFHIPEQPLVSATPFVGPSQSSNDHVDAARDDENNAAQQVIREAYRLLKPLFLLLVGCAALLFACVLLFFGNEGVFTLQWNADLWYVYVLIAAPALWRGWLALQLLPENPAD